METLAGKIALVTGASLGIGRAIAEVFAKAGMDVAVNYLRHRVEAEEVCGSIQRAGRRAIALQADVSKSTDADRLVKTVEDPGKPRRFREWFQRYGLVTVFIPAAVPLLPLPLKVFVISAGVLHTPLGKFLAVILVARLLRYFGDAWLGIRLGSGAPAFLARNAWTLAGIALAVSALFFLWIRWTGRKNRAA